MSFSAKLNSDELTVEAGSTTPVSVEISNKGEGPVQFEITLEGLDSEWTAIPVPLVTVPAGETQVEKIFFKPGRRPESAAGSYPFILKVRSFETNETRSLQGSLQIRPYLQVNLDIEPKKGFVGTMGRENDFDLTLINLGNCKQTFRMYAGDPEDSCLYEFETDQLELGPGQEKVVGVNVLAKKRKFFSGRLVGFGITARSNEQSSVYATTQGQLEIKPFINVATLIVILLVVFVAALWVALIPKPPTFNLSLNRAEAVVGQPVTISWSPASTNENVVIYAQDGQIYSSTGAPGMTTFTPIAPGSVQIRGYATVDGRKSPEQTLMLTVQAPPVILPPKISDFHLDSNNLTFGQPFTIHYKVQNATKLMLLPVGKELDPALDEIQVVADNLQTKTYTLVATNAAGQADRAQVSVRITQPSQAKIIAFTANPTELPMPGSVTLSWQVNDKAVRVELSAGGQTQVEQPTGSVVVNPDKTTVYTLTAYDEQGLTSVKTVKVTIKPPPPINPPPGQPTGATGTGADSGGSGGAVGDSSGAQTTGQ